MQNFKKEGCTITWTNDTGVAVLAGDPVFLASGDVCIAFEDIAIDATGELKTEGVFELPKTTPLTIAQGDKLFWHTATKKVTKTVTDIFVGVAHEAAASADTTVLADIEEVGQMAFIAHETTADASDLATAEALANALKVKINALLDALVANGYMAGS